MVLAPPKPTPPRRQHLIPALKGDPRLLKPGWGGDLAPDEYDYVTLGGDWAVSWNHWPRRIQLQPGSGNAGPPSPAATSKMRRYSQSHLLARRR